MGRNLTIHEQQAYDGAKMFYYLFLPSLIIIYIVSAIYQRVISIPLTIITILFFLLSLKFYRLCNQLHNDPTDTL